MTLRVLCVDDHPLLRAGVAALLSAEPDITVVAEAADAAQAQAAFARWRPDVTLMDLQLPGDDGISAMRAILATQPGARVVVLTTFRGDVTARAALAAGAAGYLLKTALRDELVACVRKVAQGQRHVCAEVSQDLLRHFGGEPLTRRETDILQRLCDGLGNREIAAALGISGETVKAHLTHVFGKLGARNRLEATAIAARRGLLGVARADAVPLSG